MAQSHNFGMSAGIVPADWLIPAFPNDFLIEYQYCAYRYLTLGFGMSGQLEGAFHKTVLFIHLALAHRKTSTGRRPSSC